MSGWPVGTIPANTGKIVRVRQRLRVRRDHPREYGENKTAICAPRRHGGPSPRIRGKCWCCAGHPNGGGTIPANTGKIHTVITVTDVYRDHPREYGENRSMGDKKAPMWGPSPRIRGKFLGGRVRACLRGTIPANTGKMQDGCPFCQCDRDHPREYGENTC